MSGNYNCNTSFLPLIRGGAPSAQLNLRSEKGESWKLHSRKPNYRPIMSTRPMGSSGTPANATPLCQKHRGWLSHGIIANLVSISGPRRLRKNCYFYSHLPLSFCGMGMLRYARPLSTSTCICGGNTFLAVSVGATFHFSHLHFLLAHIPLAHGVP